MLQKEHNNLGIYRYQHSRNKVLQGCSMGKYHSDLDAILKANMNIVSQTIIPTKKRLLAYTTYSYYQ